MGRRIPWSRPDEVILGYRTYGRGEAAWTDIREVVRLKRVTGRLGGGERVWRRPPCGTGLVP